MYVLTDTPHYVMYWHTVLSLPFLQKILSEHAGPISFQQNRLPNTLLPSGPDIAVEKPRSSLSPLTNSLLEQLEARIKELKAWLRDTELLIFNSCLREHKDASEQLQSFKVGRASFLLASVGRYLYQSRRVSISIYQERHLSGIICTYDFWNNSI